MDLASTSNQVLQKLETADSSSTDTTKVSTEPQPQAPLQISTKVSTEEPKTTEIIPQQQISSTLSVSKITIGAGGLKAATQKNKGAVPTVGGKSRTSSTTPGHPKLLKGKTARESFKQIYIELYPYYKDLRAGQKDTKVFRDFKDIVDSAAMLHRLLLFSKAHFIPECDDIDFALQTTMEWFESTLLGSFEEAYDKNDVPEMQKNALALYKLNGGLGAVNVFIAKNPIFFDHTFNPSLIASKLPKAGGPAVGYALADDFAKYMDHMLQNCKKQAELVSKIFVPEVDALTRFVNKVFEDSISEYLSAVLVAAKSKEGLGVYLHTLATSIYCCSQFLDFIANNPYKVAVDVAKLKESITSLFTSYTTDYMTKESEHLKKKIDAELDKWNKRKKEGTQSNTVEGTAILTDKEKMQAHKRMVMDTMKTIMFAPMALTKTFVGLGGFNLGKPKHQPLLEDAEPVISSPVTPTDKIEAVTYHLDDSSLGSLISLELCLNLMHINKEALGRALVITHAVDESKM